LRKIHRRARTGAGASAQNVRTNGGKTWAVPYDFGYTRRDSDLQESEKL
jgi:hypothetical protein